jgi:hypothetical protein
MAPTLHSAFPASSSARLLTCPGSYAEGKKHDTGERKSSIYSAEGTLAHAVSEAAILSGSDPSNLIGRTLSADGFDFLIDGEFIDAVMQYVDTVRGLIAMGYIVMLEQRLSPQTQWQGLKPLPIDLFGTGDCVAIHPGLKELVIADLKFGKGIAVEARGNTQLLYYGSGALDPNVLAELCRRAGVAPFRPERVRTIIVQPRAHHVLGPVREAVYTADEVRDWSRITLYSGVKRALEDNGTTFKPSEHCRWCPANPHCKALLDFAAETARKAFKDAPLENLPAAPQTDVIPADQYSNAQLADLVDRIAVVAPWFDKIKALAEERLQSGQQVPGYKLVPKRAQRAWGGSTQQEIVADLKSAGLQEADFMETKIKSPAQVEKAVGRKKYNADVKQFVGNKSSGVTMAPDGDPRKRLNGRTAREAFLLTTPAITHNKGN